MIDQNLLMNNLNNPLNSTMKNSTGNKIIEKNKFNKKK